MASRLVALCVDAADPRCLAEFYATALGWDVAERGPCADAVPTDATSFAITFMPSSTPKTLRNRIHLDLTTRSDEDQRTTVDSLLAIGARRLDVGQSPLDRHVVLADPEGNELCIIEPENRFLAECERLGAVVCDGTRDVGVFWHEALGWPLVWDQDEETAIRAPDHTGPMITWGGPPVMPKPPRNRLHLALAPGGDGGIAGEVGRLLALGATRIEGWPDREGVALADPDGNEFRVVSTDAVRGLSSSGQG